MKRSSFIHLGLVVLIAIMVSLAYAWWHQEVLRVASEAADLAVQAAERGNVQTRSSRNEVASLAEGEAYVGAHLLPLGEIVPFLEGLEATGREFGALVAVASVSDAAGEGQISIALSIEGSFDSVMRTVGTIEYGPYASAIDTLTLDTLDGTLWSATLTLLVASKTAEQTP